MSTQTTSITTPQPLAPFQPAFNIGLDESGNLPIGIFSQIEFMKIATACTPQPIAPMHAQICVALFGCSMERMFS